MHDSVMDFLRREIKEPEIVGKEILEVGSQNVNGSPRDVLASFRPSRYVGVDFAIGNGVDLVLDVAQIVEHFGRNRFDVVISTEMLEHAKDWRAAVRAMKEVLRPDGLLVITTRGPGFPYHGYPHDYWRFTMDDFAAIFEDMKNVMLANDPQFPGVFLKAWKRKTPELPPEVDLDEIVVRPVV